MISLDLNSGISFVTMLCDLRSSDRSYSLYKCLFCLFRSSCCALKISPSSSRFIIFSPIESLLQILAFRSMKSSIFR